MKKKISLSFAHLLEPEEEMCPVEHTGRKVLLYHAPPLSEDGIPLGSFFLSAPQAGLWPGLKSTARTHESCTVEAPFLFMWCQIFRDGNFKNNVHV